MFFIIDPQCRCIMIDLQDRGVVYYRFTRSWCSFLLIIKVVVLFMIDQQHRVVLYW